jgi:hypothetical protein
MRKGEEVDCLRVFPAEESSSIPAAIASSSCSPFSCYSQDRTRECIVTESFTSLRLRVQTAAVLDQAIAAVRGRGREDILPLMVLASELLDLGEFHAANVLMREAVRIVLEERSEAEVDPDVWRS